VLDATDPDEAGSAAEPRVITSMERAFALSFAGVRLRTDAAAASQARALGSAAYNDGDEIGFDHGFFDPASTEGSRTIAHEFAHVVHGRGGTRVRSADGSVGRDEVEREAADAAVDGRRPEVDGMSLTDVSAVGILTQPVQR